MYTVLRSDEFDKWLAQLKDVKGKARIVARIRSAELGNLGDVKPVGEGVSEMRVLWPWLPAVFHAKGKIGDFPAGWGRQIFSESRHPKGKSVSENSGGITDHEYIYPV